MTDAQLAEYLNLTPAEAAIVIPKLTPKRRHTYERMKQVEIDVALWQEGLGPDPRKHVMIDTERSTRRRKYWR